jgi:hypothetical protein
MSFIKSAMLGIGLLAAGQMASYAQVTIYAGKNFTGRNVTFSTPGDVNVADYALGNVGSIKVKPGWQAILVGSWSDEPPLMVASKDNPDLARAKFPTTVALRISGTAAPQAPARNLQAGSHNSLKVGQKLGTGQALISSNGKFILKLQDDGHLCIYHYNNGVQGAFSWGTMVQGFRGAYLLMQDDGNLVIYDWQNQAKWSSKTHPHYNRKFANPQNKPVLLLLGDDGTLKLYTASGAEVWKASL